MAVVAAPNRAIRESTETWPMKVAIASKTSTPYTYRCCIAINKIYLEIIHYVDESRENSLLF